MSGDLVLLDPEASIEVGNAVVARHPFKNVDVIKYIESVDDDNHVVLRSPTGDDSRQFGRVPTHTIRGTVTWNWRVKR